MTEPTPTQRQALDAAQGVYRRGGTKREGVEAGLAVLDASTPAGYFRQAPGARRPTIPAAHAPLAAAADADRLVNYLAEYGNYPVMSRCEAAGINGDAAEGCPFYGEDFCNCDPPEGH